MRYVEFDSTGASQNFCRTKTTSDIDLKFCKDTFETYIYRAMQKTQNRKIFFQTEEPLNFNVIDVTDLGYLQVDVKSDVIISKDLNKNISNPNLRIFFSIWNPTIIFMYKPNSRVIKKIY